MDGLTETELSRLRQYEGRILHVEQLTVRLPNGNTATRDVIRHPGAAAVLAVDDQSRVVLVRQYRVPLARIYLEIPAGKLNDRQEDPLACAKRELQEETGVTAQVWRKLTVMDTTPAFCDEQIHIFLATGLSQGETAPDEDEAIQTVRLPLREFLHLCLSGQISDSKTLTAALFARELLV